MFSLCSHPCYAAGMPQQFWFMDTDEPLPAMDHTGGHKESQCRVEIARAILTRVARGETIKSITADPAMPSYATLFHWLRVHAEFRDAYRALRRELAEERIERWELRRRSAEVWDAYEVKRLGRRRTGRKSSFTREKGEAVCALLEQGWAMSAINARPDMPSNKVVYRWLKTEPEFREMVAAARDEALNWLAFQRELAIDEASVDFGRAKSETARLEGCIGRLMPKVWGRPKRLMGM